MARILVVQIYSCTRSFPKDEQYGLTSQMRRSAVSCVSNLAEGFGRFSNTEKIRFYNIAYGSLMELHAQLFISMDLKYLHQVEFDRIENQMIHTKKLINGLVRSVRPQL